MELVKSLFKHSGERVVIQHEAGCTNPRGRYSHGKVVVDLDKLHLPTLRAKLAKKSLISITCAVVPNALVAMGLPISNFTYTAEELVDSELAKINRLSIDTLEILCRSVNANCGVYHFDSNRVTVTPDVIPYVDTVTITVSDDKMDYRRRRIVVNRLPPSVRSLEFEGAATMWVNPDAFKQLDHFKARNANYADYRGTPLHPKSFYKTGDDLPIELQLDNCLIDSFLDHKRADVIKAIYVLRYMMDILGC